MTAPRFALIGASGRMGREILALAQETGALRPTWEVSRGGARTLDSSAKGEVDVVVDFSLPEATVEVAGWCRENGRPLVSGVTGIDGAQRAALIEASREVAVLWAPNMSLGIAVMAQMFKPWASLKGFDFQIEELHHRQKKDRPSGTALFLQGELEKAAGASLPPPLAIRGGGVFGIHRAWALGEDETITIEHTAMNRRVFARGAIAAARWIIGRSPGLYGLADVLA